MPDDSTDLQNNPALLSQLLALLSQSNGGSGTAPGVLQPASNVATNSNGSAFQLGVGGQPTSMNPGSDPNTSAWDSATGQQFWNGKPINASGSYIEPPGNNSSVGGSQYGMASGSDGQTGFVNSPPQYQQYQNQLNGAATQQNSQQLNQLLQGLINNRSATPAAASSAPPPPPVAAAVPNNQAAYTAPSAAQIPGMNLATQLQAGMPQSAIMAQGGPKTASTGSGLQFPGQYNPVGQSMSSQGIGISAPTASPLAGLSGAASIPMTALQTYQRAQQLQNQGFGPATRNFSPSSSINPSVGTTQDLGSVDAVAPMGAGGSDYAAGGLDAMTGANAAPLSAGGANYAAGGLDSGSDASIGAGGGAGAASGAGSAAAGLIQGVGNAIQKAYTPIKLNIPAIQPGLKQPTPPVFTSPQMIG
jgi:hypothetical protein